MATTLTAGDTLEVKLFSQNLAQQGINVLHYIVTGIAGGAMTDQTLATNLDGSFAPLYKAFLPTVCAYKGLRLQKIFPLPVAAAVVATGNAGAGLRAFDPLPSQAAMVIKKASNLAGRINRGRAYLPFWSEAENDASGFPTAGALVFADNWRNFALNTIVVVVAGVTVTLTPVIWHDATVSVTIITGSVVRERWGTQRRRSEINKADVIGP